MSSAAARLVNDFNDPWSSTLLTCNIEVVGNVRRIRKIQKVRVLEGLILGSSDKYKLAFESCDAQFAPVRSGSQRKIPSTTASETDPHSQNSIIGRQLPFH